jgi:Lrp/AsnC family transcriptional regulator for asnA, asnC and gidA
MISKKLGISEATVRNRLNRLIGEDYVKIVAVRNPLKLGFEIIGIIRIEVVVQKQDNVAKELEKIKSLWNIAYTTGTADINTEFLAKSLEELNDLLLNRISQIDGINRTETSKCFKISTSEIH